MRPLLAVLCVGLALGWPVLELADQGADRKNERGRKQAMCGRKKQFAARYGFTFYCDDGSNDAAPVSTAWPEEKNRER